MLGSIDNHFDFDVKCVEKWRYKQSIIIKIERAEIGIEK